MHEEQETNEQRGEKRAGVRETNQEQALNYREQLMVTRGEVCGGWVKQVMGIKECTCDEHWVMFGIVESLYRVPETNITLYLNYL